MAYGDQRQGEGTLQDCGLCGAVLRDTSARRLDVDNEDGHIGQVTHGKPCDVALHTHNAVVESRVFGGHGCTTSWQNGGSHQTFEQRCPQLPCVIPGFQNSLP